MELKYNYLEKDYSVIYNKKNYTITCIINGTTYELNAELISQNCISMMINGENIVAYIHKDKDGRIINIKGNIFNIKNSDNLKKINKTPEEELNHQIISSQMPGNIVKINVKVGDKVTVGDTICIVESMKMETSFISEISGKVSKVHNKEGELVKAFQPIVELIKE